MKIQVPVDENLAQELGIFWEDVMARYGRGTRGELLGEKLEHHGSTVYLERRGERLASACLLIISKRVPILGAFGKVATALELRGSGLSTELCSQAVRDFQASGGEALFLGTALDNSAARIYHRLGWRRLAGGETMVNVTSRETPEAFLVDYFRGLGPATVEATTAADEIPALPLLVSPHDWQVLDANADILSIRYTMQHTTRGLFPRYLEVARDGRGASFSARSSERGVVGLSTARLDDVEGCRVDGFAHRYYIDIWGDLLRAAIDWGARQGVKLCRATVSVEDEEKRSLFEGLGFSEVGPADEFALDVRTVASVRMEISLRV